MQDGWWTNHGLVKINLSSKFILINLIALCCEAVLNPLLIIHNTAFPYY